MRTGDAGRPLAVGRWPWPSMWPRNLCSAVRADLSEAVEIVPLHGFAIVATAEGAMPYEHAVSPALGCRDVPDVLLVATQAKRRLDPEFFCHDASLSGATTIR